MRIIITALAVGLSLGAGAAEARGHSYGSHSHSYSYHARSYSHSRSYSYHPRSYSHGSAYYRNVDGNRVHRPVFASRRPAGASAQCADGSWSFSQHSRGTCSHHGGIR
jgi:hypothetical protein